MTLEALGNIGEFVGGLAVVVTLMYLAVQVRQNTNTLRANGIQDLTENMSRIAEVLIQPENADSFLRGARSYSSLTPEDRFRFGQLPAVWVARFETVLEYRQRGIVDDECGDPSLLAVSNWDPGLCGLPTPGEGRQAAATACRPTHDYHELIIRGLAADNRQLGVPQVRSILASGLL